ncbi:hypothetical protein Scep_023818 [Stephania cephalantha]|uniref:Uncharacterized protein n=1 Tax=Stephania cephalantha TaxID=152367 RepID=A0AAP0F2H7_9MAGN
MQFQTTRGAQEQASYTKHLQDPYEPPPPPPSFTYVKPSPTTLSKVGARSTGLEPAPSTPFQASDPTQLQAHEKGHLRRGRQLVDVDGRVSLDRRSRKDIKNFGIQMLSRPS